MILRNPTFLLILLSVCQLTFQSPSPYSLQPAVEALSDREAQLALREEIENGNLEDFIDSDDFEWSNDYDGERGRGQRALARYLARTDYDDSDYRKRAMYRKRDSSVFRERTRLPSQPPQHRRQQQAELAERFLRAIEDEREKEREEEYREELKNLWGRYQKEESNIERELFNDNDIESSDYPLSYEDDRRKKKKRQRGEVEIAPYWNDKRSMPLLPWLPAQRKKRFPVTKRSPKSSEMDKMARAVAETNDKVAQDLQGIFGNGADNKKIAADEEEEDKKKKKRKRSSDEMAHQSAADKGHEMKNVEIEQPSPASSGDDKKRIVKRHWKDGVQFDSEEDYGQDDEDDEEIDDTDEDGSEENGDKRRKKKKKREAKRSLEIVGDESIPEKKISIKKKSLEWSTIFGYDRKKKSSGMMMVMGHGPREDEDRRRKKRACLGPLCDIDEITDYENDSEEDEDESDGDEEKRRRRKKKRSKGEDKLDAMDRKLKTIENLIVEDTAKYYEHNNENLNPSEVKEIRSQLADRLATAYSIEKMRKAIGRLKQSIAFQKGLEQNLLEAAQNGSDNDAEDDDDDDDDKKKKAKRVAVKKEKAEFDNNDHEVESPFKKVVSNKDEKNDLDESDDDKKKKKKKRSKKILTNDEPPMSEGYMGGGGGSIFQSNCPILDSIEKRCRGIDILSGAHQNLLEACGEHQLCYLCGDPELQCDYKYLYNIKEVCGYNAKCKMNAAQALELLRRSSEKVGPRECIRNPCLNSALRSIGY